MKRAAIVFVCILCLLILTGCNFVLTDTLTEEAAYNNVITAFFNALDERDHEAIYNLFSPSVRQQGEDLKIQIDKLLSVYTGPIDEIGWNGILGKGSSYDHGKYSQHAYTCFPVRSGNTYYWCYLDLMYENTYDDQETGIIQLDFFTADEYCILEYDDKLKIADSVGLTVHADATIDSEIRCINGHPYMYTSSAPSLDMDDVKNFFKTSNSFSEFTKQFGSPNAENIYCCYELSNENGERRYLKIGTDKDAIYEATVVNEFEYIKTIYTQSD